MEQRVKEICDATMEYIHYVLKQNGSKTIRFGRKTLRDAVGLRVEFDASFSEHSEAIDYLLENNFIKQLGQHTVGLGTGKDVKPYTPMLDKSATVLTPPVPPLEATGKERADTAIASRIREARKHVRQTQVELADKIGVSSVYVSEYERAARVADDDILKSVAKATGVNNTWLETGDGDMLNDGNAVPTAPNLIGTPPRQAKRDQDVERSTDIRSDSVSAQTDSAEQSSPTALSATNDKSEDRFAVEVDGWSKPIDDHQLEQELLTIHRMVNTAPDINNATQKIQTLERLRLIFKDKSPGTALVLEHIIHDYAELQQGEAA